MLSKHDPSFSISTAMLPLQSKTPSCANMHTEGCQHTYNYSTKRQRITSEGSYNAQIHCIPSITGLDSDLEHDTIIGSSQELSISITSETSYHDSEKCQVCFGMVK